MGKGPMIVFTTILTTEPAAKRLIECWATPADQGHVSSRRTAAARDFSLLARAVLRGLLSHVTGRGDWVVQADSRGKLFAETKSGEPGPYICLAHTLGMVACAVGDMGPLGIDVERHRPRAFSAISDYSFGPRERAMVSEKGMDAFYRIWTLREAMGKVTGQGLELVTDGRDRALNDSQNISWVSQCDDGCWVLTYRQPEPGFSLALASAVVDKINDVGKVFEAITADTLM